MKPVKPSRNFRHRDRQNNESDPYCQPGECSRSMDRLHNCSDLWLFQTTVTSQLQLHHKLVLIFEFSLLAKLLQSFSIRLFCLISSSQDQSARPRLAAASILPVQFLLTSDSHEIILIMTYLILITSIKIKLIEAKVLP